MTRHAATTPSTAQLVEQLAQLLLHKGHKLACAESCTGGLIAGSCTELAGSSNWLERGFVTYSNEAKTEMLGVEAAMIRRHGAVSEQVARAIVRGALAHSHAQVAVAVTGVAGPTGGSPAKPVGTVWFGFAAPGWLLSETHVFPGDRAAVRQATVQHALTGLIKLLG